MHSQKFAIATTDGVAVCEHLARSAAFLVYAVQDGHAALVETRNRLADTCGNHKSFVELLEGCSAVICGGIGQGAVDSLRANGIEPIVLASRGTVEEALNGYLAGTLKTTSETVCLCH